jgi:hypothetical protein
MSLLSLMTLLLSASLVNYFQIITMSLTGFLRWELLLLISGFLSHTKFHTTLRDSEYLLSDALLYVFPVKNISNATSRFPILYSTSHAGFLLGIGLKAKNDFKLYSFFTIRYFYLRLGAKHVVLFTAL